MKQLNSSTISPAATCGDLLIDVVPLLMATVRAESRQFRPSDLSIAQFRALAFIDRHEGTSLSLVAEAIGLTLSSVSKLMEGLVETAYVRQEVCPEDRRRAQLYATGRGRSAMTQARRQMGARLAEYLSSLSDTALEEISTGLLRLQTLFTPPCGH